MLLFMFSFLLCLEVHRCFTLRNFIWVICIKKCQDGQKKSHARCIWCPATTESEEQHQAYTPSSDLDTAAESSPVQEAAMVGVLEDALDGELDLARPKNL